MPCQISVRDIDFHASATGVRIRVTTDAPAHLFVRLSSKTPWIHKKPSLRRGVAFAEDVRFCFTVFEDNEQNESGDTLEHTWWKKDWPVCTTKWLYLWGSKSGEVCQSTTAPFSYHNTGIDPVPPPRMLNTYTSVEPNMIWNGGGLYWTTRHMAKMVDENAKAVLLHGFHYGPTTFRQTGCRKPGAAGRFTASSPGSDQFWCICGLDDALDIELYCQTAATVKWWLLGYFNSNITMLDTAVEKRGTGTAWQTFNFSDVLPDNAVAGIFAVGGRTSQQYGYSMRAYGSTDDRQPLAAGFQHAVVKLNDKRVQFKYNWSSAWTYYLCELLGYFTAGIDAETNGINTTPPSTGVWTTRRAAVSAGYPLLVFSEHTNLVANSAIGQRKVDGDHAWYNYDVRHSWPMSHTDEQGDYDLICSHASDLIHQIAVVH